MKRFYLTILIALVIFAPSVHGQSKPATSQPSAPSVAIAISPNTVSEATSQPDDTAGLITIKNNGNQITTAIDWELILTGEVDGKELRIVLQFHNSVKIHPGERIGLKEKVYLSNRELTSLSKEVVVRRIENEDGTSVSYPR